MFSPVETLLRCSQGDRTVWATILSRFDTFANANS